jgi:CysZ protein
MRASPIAIVSCFSPSFRRFIASPILLNILIFIVLSSLTLDYAQTISANFESHLPTWLIWIKWLLWPLLVLVLLIAYGYSFNLITTIIAAPFLGLLAEKIEVQITGVTPPNESLSQLIPRTFKRELTKLGYFLPRSLCMALLIFVLIFLPGANLLGLLLGGLWSSWCLALQYCDYAADNHQLPFNYVRTQLGQDKLNSFAFGGLVLFGSMIPVVNIVMTPLAVAAGTINWVKRNKH